MLFCLGNSNGDATANILIEVSVVDYSACSIFTEVDQIAATIHALHLERECINELLFWIAFISESSIEVKVTSEILIYSG